jgi:hypothetical protein
VGEVPLADELEAGARLRFVRWDSALWRRFLAGPAAELARGLDANSGDSASASRALEAYVRLGCEGVGLGYLFPAESGAENAFSLTWNSLLPSLLPQVASEQRADTLAACWNLGENLELSPVWMRRLFHRSLRELTRLDDLEELVARVSRDAFEPPESVLTTVGRIAWLDLGAEDRRFLPGRVHFLAPRVACVHDRERVGGAGVDGISCGVWLGAQPRALGRMGCAEDVPPGLGEVDGTLLTAARGLDPRLDEAFAGARNTHSAVVSLATSQHIAALLP